MLSACVKYQTTKGANKKGGGIHDIISVQCVHTSIISITCFIVTNKKNIILGSIERNEKSNHKVNIYILQTPFFSFHLKTQKSHLFHPSSLASEKETKVKFYIHFFSFGLRWTLLIL